MCFLSVFIVSKCDLYVDLHLSSRPPRLMGEGFVVMQSNDVDIYYYQDEPGTLLESWLRPEPPQINHLMNCFP